MECEVGIYNKPLKTRLFWEGGGDLFKIFKSNFASWISTWRFSLKATNQFVIWDYEWTLMGKSGFVLYFPKFYDYDYIQFNIDLRTVVCSL